MTADGARRPDLRSCPSLPDASEGGFERLLFEPDPTDETLMERVQARIPAGLALLHQRHASLLGAVCMQVLHNANDAEDLVLELLVEIWNRADSYDPTKGAACAWMVTMARRRAIDRLRQRETYARAVERFLGETTDRVGGWTHVHEEISQSERNEHLLRAFATLPAEQQSAVRDAYHEGLTHREIAARSATAVGTIRTRLDLGLRKMKRALLDFDDLPWPVAGPQEQPWINMPAHTRGRFADPILVR